MFEYREVVQCNDCGKVYDIGWGVPAICKRCGNRILDGRNSLYDMTSSDKRSDDNEEIKTGFMDYHRLANGTLTIAKPTLRGWVFRNKYNSK